MNVITVLDRVKNYNRPVRMVVWVLVISGSFIYLILAKNKAPVDPLAEIMLIGMFADLGIYGVARTVEKNVQAKIDGTQGIVNKVADSPNTDTKAEVKVVANDSNQQLPPG